MSADNWAVCPECSGKGVAIEDNYRTFREDYEIYNNDEGLVEVIYHGRCSICGLTLKFKHEHAIGEQADAELGAFDMAPGHG